MPALTVIICSDAAAKYRPTSSNWHSDWDIEMAGVSRVRMVAKTGWIRSAGRKGKQKRWWMNLCVFGVCHGQTQILNFAPNSLTPMKIAALDPDIRNYFMHGTPGCSLKV